MNGRGAEVRTPAVEPARPGRPDGTWQALPGLQRGPGYVVYRDRRELPHQRPAAITNPLRALLIQSARTLLMLAAGATAGAALAALVLAVGLTAAAWIAVAVSVLVLVVGAVDHVWTRP